MDFQNERKRVSHGFHGEGVTLVSKSPGGGQMGNPGLSKEVSYEQEPLVTYH